MEQLNISASKANCFVMLKLDPFCVDVVGYKIRILALKLLKFESVWLYHHWKLEKTILPKNQNA